jgi:hypothetical protein
VVLSFTQGGFEGEVAGRAVHLDWSDVHQIVSGSKGELVLCTNAWHWLPRRAFASPSERGRFVETVVERMAQEELRSEAQPVAHPILPDASEYRVVRAYASAGPLPSQPFVDLTLRRGEDERRLRFLRVTDLELEEEAVRKRAVRVGILAAPFPELGGPAVHVLEVREDEELEREDEEDDDLDLFPSVMFDAEEVVDLDAAVPPTPGAATHSPI